MLNTYSAAQRIPRPRFVPEILPTPETLLDDPLPHIDTVVVIVRHVPPNIEAQLQAINGKGVVRLGKAIRVDTPYGFFIAGWPLIVQLPTTRAIKQLARLPKVYQAKLNRVDVAIDFIVPHYGRAILKDFFPAHAVLKWRQAGPMYVGGTTYWIDFRGTNRKRERLTNLAFYSDRESKLCGLCSGKLELRFMGARTIQRAGIDSIESLLQLNPQALFDKYVQLVDFTGSGRAQLLKDTSKLTNFSTIKVKVGDKLIFPDDGMEGKRGGLS